MGGFDNLAREYEARRFGPSRRLDLHGEGPAVARERALHWIQSFAHESPGSELLLVLERGTRPGGRPGQVRRSVESLLSSLVGGLVESWSPFTLGTVAVRISDDPRLNPAVRSELTITASDEEGRTEETAGVALPLPESDIPPPLLGTARQVAEMRRDRESLSTGLAEVVLRRVWIDAQAVAMTERLSFEDALALLLQRERELGFPLD
jgi:hypothetical protein